MWSPLHYVAITCTPEDIAEEGMTEVEPTWVHKRCVTAHYMVGNDALPPSRNAYELEDGVPYYQHQEKQKVLLTTINIVDDTMTEDNPDVERRVGARENRDQRHLLLLLGPLEAPDLPRRPEEERAEVLGEEDRESAPVVGRLVSIDKRCKELLEMAKIRKQRLLDAPQSRTTCLAWLLPARKILRCGPVPVQILH